MENEDCLLMVELENRKLFTKKENYSELIEFSKAVNAEMSIVKADANILELPELVPALCNANFKQKQPEKIEVIKKLNKKKVSL